MEQNSIIYANGLRTRTWTYKEKHGYGCAECCNGDRCDEDCTARYRRPNCPHCKGKGWIPLEDLDADYAALRAKADRYEKALQAISFTSLTVGQPGCTWADTDFDSMAVAAGYNQCVENIVKMANKFLEQEAEAVNVELLQAMQQASQNKEANWQAVKERMHKLNGEKEPVPQQADKDDWISVNERLPHSDEDNSVYCLVNDTYNGIVVRPYNQAHNCWDQEDGDDYYTDAVGGKITHWMPLPEHPKKEVING